MVDQLRWLRSSVSDKNNVPKSANSYDTRTIGVKRHLFWGARGANSYVRQVVRPIDYYYCCTTREITRTTRGRISLLLPISSTTGEER